MERLQEHFTVNVIDPVVSLYYRRNQRLAQVLEEMAPMLESYLYTDVCIATCGRVAGCIRLGMCDLILFTALLESTDNNYPSALLESIVTYM